MGLLYAGSMPAVAATDVSKLPVITQELVAPPFVPKHDQAAKGGPIAAVRDGDTIVIDPKKRTLDLDVPDAEIARRMIGWKAPDGSGLRPGSVHHKYVRLVSSAHHGCVV